MTQIKTTDYDITDYGIESASYFQGHGVSFTKYKYCSLGCGDTYAGALEDALEQAACSGYDITLTEEDEPKQFKGKGPSASKQHEEYCEKEDHSDCGDSELYYYVGLRWNEEDS